MNGFENTMLIVFLTIVFILIALYTIGVRQRKREEQVSEEEVPIGDMTLVMVKLTDRAGAIIDELPLYFHVQNMTDLKRQMGEWMTRVHVAGYFQNRDCGDIKAWPPSMIGNTYWRVQNWGKAADHAKD